MLNSRWYSIFSSYCVALVFRLIAMPALPVINTVKFRPESRRIKMSKLPKHCVVKFSTITKRLKNNNFLQPSVKLAIKTEPGLYSVCKG